MVKTVTGFITGMRDAIGKIIWLAGEKTIRPIMDKLDEFGKWVGDTYKKATGKGASEIITSAVVKKFGNLKFAEKYGIKAYKQLKKVLSGTGLEAHHLVEQRFAKALGLTTGDIMSVAVDKAEHQIFTNAWRKLVPYGSNYKAYSREELYEMAKKIYKDYPALLDGVKQTLF